MPKVLILVEAELPSNVDDELFCGYAIDSIRACIGGYHPDDPIFNLDRNSVKGSIIRDWATKEPNDNEVKMLKNRLNANGLISVVDMDFKFYGS